MTEPLDSLDHMVIYTGEDNYATQAFYSTMGYARRDIVLGKTINRDVEQLCR